MKKSILFLIILVVCLCKQASAQLQGQARIDSLLTELSKAQSDTNKVNTLLVWYAGHGKSASGKTYWVPVDGKKDDIYSYYNYGPLKSLMENYSANVNNTLVVSDAAGSDPSFYELTR